MKTIDLNFDLNLLKVAAALAATRNVTRAAEQLGMSQSGFSTALARLRQAVGEPLFLRSAEGMTPTPRALQMVAVAQRVLADVSEGVLATPGFDPKIASTEFRLAMADVAETVFLPRLLARLADIAPGISLRCVLLEAQALRSEMAAGEVDLALGYFPDLEDPSFYRQRLYDHSYACLLRRGHPLLEGGLNLKSYVQASHAVVSSPARSSSLLESFLSRKRIVRRVAVRTPHHLSLPAVVESTDLIATVPLATAARFANLGTTRLLALPFPPPRFVVHQHWHPLRHHDPANRWLRSLIAELFTTDADEWTALEESLYKRRKAWS